MDRMAVRWVVGLAASLALAGCGGQARDSGIHRIPGELGGSGGAMGSAATGGSGQINEVSMGGSNVEVPPGASGSGAGGGSSTGGTAPSTGGVWSTGGAPVTVSDGGTVSPGNELAACTCVDPTAPQTTLAECKHACVASGLALCDWGGMTCAPGIGGEPCGCDTYGLPAPGGAGFCQLLALWHTHSQPWNGLSTDATITFARDWTLTGVPYFTGKWSLDGTKLSIWGTTGQDMTCDYPDDWTLTFSQDCNTAPLIPIGSGCTGARRYLDWDVTLTRL